MATSPSRVVPGSALTYMLSQVEHRVSRRVEAVLGAGGPTLDQWRVLSLLADGDGHPMSEIAAHAMVPAPTLTKIVDRLVDAALVYRRADDTDRRRVLVFLSEHGHTTYRRIAPDVAGIDATITDALGPADTIALAALLAKLGSLPD